MAVKILIVTNDNDEYLYCRAVCKLTDNTLVDADFEKCNSSGLSDGMAQALGMSTVPLVLFPYPGINAYGSVIEKMFINYPRVHCFVPFVKAYGAYPSLPEALAITPDRLPPGVTGCGGKDGAGTSDWNTGAGLMFVEEAPLMMVGLTEFVITNITDQGSGVARIYSTALSDLSAVNMRVHITGATGWANDPNGVFSIASVVTGSDYITITHTLGAGTFGGSPTAKIHYTSGAISVICAKIRKIQAGRNDCSVWEAVYAAQQTGSNSGVFSVNNGYGKIDVAAAIAFAGAIIDDPHDTLGDINTLSVTVDGEGAANFTMDEVENARTIDLYDNGELLKTIDMDLGEAYSWSQYPVGLDLHTYYAQAIRDSQKSDESNEVTTNITELASLPQPPIYAEGWDVYYIVNSVVKHSTVDKIFQNVSNPLRNNAGIVTTEYLLTNGDLVDERRLFCSMGDLLVSIKGDYINNINYHAVNIYENYDLDLAGLNFNGCDFTVDGDYDFTDTILANNNFINAIFPAGYSDAGVLNEAGRLLIISQVAYFKPRTVLIASQHYLEDSLA